MVINQTDNRNDRQNILQKSTTYDSRKRSLSVSWMDIDDDDDDLHRMDYTEMVKQWSKNVLQQQLVMMSQ